MAVITLLAVITLSVATGRKGDLNDFERGMVVGARQAGLSISETADLLGFSRTTISWGLQRKYPVSGSCVEEMPF